VNDTDDQSRDDPIAIPLDPIEALKALLAVDPDEKPPDEDDEDPDQ
jgi:hypothetical protein